MRELVVKSTIFLSGLINVLLQSKINLGNICRPVGHPRLCSVFFG